MKHAIFVDTDVILDLLTMREHHYDAAAALFSKIDQKKITAYTSPVIFANLHYILCNLKGNQFAKNSLKKLRLLVNILEVNEKIIDLALASDFRDFEDAIQYYTATEHKLHFLITRNLDDYKTADISVMDAGQYLKLVEHLELQEG